MSDATNDFLQNLGNLLSNLSTVPKVEEKDDARDITLSYCGQPITVKHGESDGMSIEDICRDRWEDLGFAGPDDASRMTVRDDEATADGASPAVDKGYEPQESHSYTITVPRETKGSN